MEIADPTIARGNVVRGLRISSLMDDANSSPLNANAIFGQKFNVFQFHCGRMFIHVKCVADPCVRHR